MIFSIGWRLDCYFKRARPDLQVDVVFLCTQKSKPTQQDYKKFTRVIQKLICTISFPLILCFDNKDPDKHSPVTWNIDASYAVHHNMRSHTRACLLLGIGTMLSFSCKQKLVTKSFTEAELVDVDDAMTFIMWTKYFFEAQAMDLPENSKL